MYGRLGSGPEGKSPVTASTQEASQCIDAQIRVCKQVRQALVDAGLWRATDEGTRAHLVGPQPFLLSTEEASTLKKLGQALLAFYKAVNTLYLRRTDYRWAADYLDIGKPDDLLRHARMNYHKRALPLVIRPDILITQHGFVITELDSVPGGIGHLDCLSAAYERAGFDLLGGPRGMRDGFAQILREASGKDEPVCAIVVSDESEDYRPEMAYLASELRAVGFEAYTVHPRDVRFTEDGLYLENGSRIDVVYRFFELFDLLNIPKSELIAYAAKKRLVAVTPPYKHFLEEKLLLALLHSEPLRPFWQDELGEEYYELLRQTVSPTWIMDNRPVPPHAEISGFRWRGVPIRDWWVVAEGTQKERRLVLKPSGFSPLAWGSRGVKVGHDLSQEEWARSVDDALASFDTCPYVIQPFHDSIVQRVGYYDESTDSLRPMDARVRLCAYYYVVGDEAKLSGVLATACSSEKKLIHGMSDAVMAPCSVPTNGSYNRGRLR
ncbi:MAG: hypothetical protein QHI38_08150 [Armatimonadota bacterium]|nr:hypothetical protein [Armatimonadota bacterium]